MSEHMPCTKRTRRTSIKGTNTRKGVSLPVAVVAAAAVVATKEYWLHKLSFDFVLSVLCFNITL